MPLSYIGNSMLPLHRSRPKSPASCHASIGHSNAYIDRRRFCVLGAAAAASLLLPAGISGCAGRNEPRTTAKPSYPLHSYDWSHLTHTDTILGYDDGAGLVAKQGIDVSKHEGTIDWAQVAAAGIEFAMIRVGYRGYTEGEIQDDPTFEYNISHALANGIKVGVYFFSQAISTSEAAEEAAYVLEKVKDYELHYPIAFDIEENNITEERIAGLTREEMTSHAVAFCEHVKDAGYVPLVYGNNNWLNGYMDLKTLANLYDLWLAEYNPQPSVNYQFTMWQYSNTGSVAGITGNVDLNLCFKEY